ncbi:MAG: hypothetical protein ACJASV_001814 [Pseudorhodobacter sp.]|jgi:hypothetical protein
MISNILAFFSVKIPLGGIDHKAKGAGGRRHLSAQSDVSPVEPDGVLRHFATQSNPRLQFQRKK